MGKKKNPISGEFVFYFVIGIIIAILGLMILSFQNNIYIGKDYALASETKDYYYKFDCGYGNACSVENIYYNPFFINRMPLLDIYKNMSNGKKIDFSACAIGSGSYLVARNPYTFDGWQLHNVDTQYESIINTDFFMTKQPINYTFRERDYSSYFFYDEDSAGRTCDNATYNIIVFADKDRTECRFTAKEINDFFKKVKSKNKELMILICNETKVLISYPFYPQGVVSHFMIAEEDGKLYSDIYNFK